MFGQYNFSVLLGQLNPLFHIQFASWRPTTWWEWKEASYGSAVLVLRITSEMTFPCRPGGRHWGKKAQSSALAGITSCSSVLLIPSPNLVAFGMMDRLDLSRWQILGVRWCAEFGSRVLSKSCHVPWVAKRASQTQTSHTKAGKVQQKQADCPLLSEAHTTSPPSNFVLLIYKSLLILISHTQAISLSHYLMMTKPHKITFCPFYTACSNMLTKLLFLVWKKFQSFLID